MQDPASRRVLIEKGLAMNCNDKLGVYEFTG